MRYIYPICFVHIPPSSINEKVSLLPSVARCKKKEKEKLKLYHGKVKSVRYPMRGKDYYY